MTSDHPKRPIANLSRRHVLAGATAAAANMAFPSWAATAPLKTIAGKKGIQFGSALDWPDHRIFGNPKVGAIYAKQCSQFVMGHQLMWNQNQRQKNHALSFAKADRAVSFARKHGVKMAGHAAIWHGSAPHWLAGEVAKGNGKKLIVNHVSQMLDHYRGQFNYWVVVNEPFDYHKRRKDGLFPTPFADALGEDYIDLAFQVAAEADPTAILVLNEVGLEHDYPDAQRKRSMMIKTVKRLKKKGIPIHAVGLQAHLVPHYPFNKSKFRNFLAQIQRLGLKVYLTEMDVDDNSFPTDPARRDKGVAKMIKGFLDVCLANPACDTVVMWGLINKYNWLNWPEQKRPDKISKYSLQLPRKDGTPHRPTLYDDALQPTLAWHAVAAALEKAKPR